MEMKDSLCIGLFVASSLVLFSVQGAVNLSDYELTKRVGESVSVKCKDDAARAVHWKGPKGVLSGKTKPEVKYMSYGTVLSIDKARPEDSGIYNCFVGNEHKTLRLTVGDGKINDIGTLNINFRNATKQVNESFFVSCNDSAGHSVKWRSPKGELTSRTKPSVRKSDALGTLLVFDKITVAEHGMYTCSSGIEQKHFYLTVVAPMQFVGTPTEVTALEGQDATLRCEVLGNDEKPTWSDDSMTDITVVEPDKFKELADGLLIRNVQRADSKNYTCKAVQRSTGTVADRTIHLKVHHKPVFTHPRFAQQEFAWSYVNSTINLTCVVVANPPARFEWFKQGDRVKKYGTIINQSEDVSILQLFVKDRSTFGNYSCQAKNKYGNLEKRFSLEEGAKPDEPKYFEITEVDAHEIYAQIQGPDSEPEPGMETKGFVAKFKKKDESFWNERVFNISEDSNYRLDGLDQLTEYEVKVATLNAAGLSDFTNITTFHTPSKADCIRFTFATILFSLLLTIW